MSVLDAARHAATVRSNRLDVRNPVLALPAVERMKVLVPTYERTVLASILLDIRKDALERAEHCWRTHKAPMAVYWKGVAVYAGHIARAIR